MTLVVVAKILGLAGYVFLEHLLGKTKFGSALGILKSIVKKEGNGL